MSTQFAKALSSKLMFWIAGAIVGTYLLLGIDTKTFHATQGNVFKRAWKSLHMPAIKLGIDLQGGTYLSLGVNIEKGLENRLTSEARSLDKLFKKEGLHSLPLTKELKDKALVLTFAHEEKALQAYNMIKEKVGSLKPSLSGKELHIVLSGETEARIRSTVVEQAVTVLRTRLDTFDVRGLMVQQHGERGIVIQLPGLGDADDIKASIMRQARLEFKQVDKMGHTQEALLEDYDGEIPHGKVIVQEKRQGSEEGVWYLVSAFPDVTGEQIADAHMSYGEFGKPCVSFTFNSEGGRDFYELTSNNIGKQIAIILDNVVISAPRINDRIGAQGQITGNFSQDEAIKLSALLKSGTLQAPLTIEQENRVGASLGQDSIEKGLMSCVIALLLLLLFALIYYRLAGFFAALALAYNIFLTLLMLSWFKATLTLPGIAGMVLTIGMAIDSSILIYEKMREELADGQPFRKALNDGFSSAMVVILDSNITTFLTGVILFYFGGPAIRGFAVTLMIGIIATVAAGVYFLRALFDFTLDHTAIQKFKV